MAVRKAKHIETDEQRRIRDRADRARRATPPRDPSGAHHASCVNIARAAGVQPDVVLDSWDERASHRQYDGNVSRDEAERLAVDDVRGIYPPQQKGLGL